MKRTILAALTMLLLMSTQLLNAQNSSAIALFDKYSGKDGFTTVSISKELFGMFADMNTDDPDAKEVKAMMEQLDGIKILMYETKDSNSTGTALVSFKSEVSKLQVSGYSELMVVKQPGEEVKFLAMKKGDKIGELLLVISGEKEAGFISITGTIDMATIGKLSKTMNFEGMDNLKKLDEEKK
ncbi:MAG: DUF4252 domain-containing protein [Bacteroidales bacterium]|nr:DUF4252 domain-containing protein [Bacteroidales bacterium]